MAIGNFYDIDFDDFVDKYMPVFMDDLDVVIRKGDLDYGDTQQQDISFILEANKGQFYYDLRIGAGLRKKLNSNIDKVILRKLISESLRYCNITPSKIRVLTEKDLRANNINDPEILGAVRDQGFLISIETI